MRLSKKQMHSSASLIKGAEVMVEPYWDAENGQKLGRSLTEARAAFDESKLCVPDRGAMRAQADGAGAIEVILKPLGDSLEITPL
jgi:hypothetical protein